MTCTKCTYMVVSLTTKNYESLLIEKKTKVKIAPSKKALVIYTEFHTVQFTKLK